MDPVDPVALARQLIDIDSTTGREGEVAARAGGVSAATAATRCSSSRWRRRRRATDQRHRRGGRATAGVLDPLRLRAAVLPEPARGRRALRPRRLRREGHPRGAGGGGRAAAGGAARRASAWCSWPARSGAATARWRPIASRRAVALSDQRRAHRQPPWRRHPRRVSRAARHDGRGRALGLSRAGRVGHREAASTCWWRCAARRGPRTRCWAARTTPSD